MQHQQSVVVVHHLLLTRRLLQFDHLFVGEERAVVDEGHAVQGLALGTHCRLRNPAPVNLNCLCRLAHITAEEG